MKPKCSKQLLFLALAAVFATGFDSVSAKQCADVNTCPDLKIRNLTCTRHNDNTYTFDYDVVNTDNNFGTNNDFFVLMELFNPKDPDACGYECDKIRFSQLVNGIGAGETKHIQFTTTALLVGCKFTCCIVIADRDDDVDEDAEGKDNEKWDNDILGVLVTGQSTELGTYVTNISETTTFTIDHYLLSAPPGWSVDISPVTSIVAANCTGLVRVTYFAPVGSPPGVIEIRSETREIPFEQGTRFILMETVPVEHRSWGGIKALFQAD